MLTVQISADTDKNTVRAVLAAIFTLHPDMGGDQVSVTVGDINVTGPASVVMPPETAAAPGLTAAVPPPPGPADVFPVPPPVGGVAPTAAPPVPPVETLASAPPVSTATPGPAAASPAPSGVELDKNGLPWDARIHAGGKVKNADGSWRARRNTPADVVASVTAELKAALAVPGPAAAPAAVTPPPAPAAEPVAAPPPPAAAAPPPAPVTPPPAAPPETPAPPPPPAALATPPATAAADNDAAQLFARAMRQATAMQNAGQIDVPALQEVCTGFGLAAVRDLIHRPDMVPAFEAMLRTHELIHAGRFQAIHIPGLLQQIGASAPGDLVTNPSLLAAYDAQLDAYAG